MQRKDKSHLQPIHSDDLPSFWREGRLPSLLQQADSLIAHIGENQRTPLSWWETTASEICSTVGVPIIKEGDGAGFGWLHGQLRPQKLYDLGQAQGHIPLRLTFKGWQRFEELKKTSRESRTAFMAMKFGDQTLNRVVDEYFKPAVARTGFELRLLTDGQPAGLIDDQLRAAILGSRFLIADLTHGNHGAYWEAGFAEGLGLPVIYSCEKAAWKAGPTHFDTNHLVTVIWDEAKLDEAGRQLTAIIRATLRSEAKQAD